MDNDDPYKRENADLFDYIASSSHILDDNFDEMLNTFWATFSEGDGCIAIDVLKND